MNKLKLHILGNPIAKQSAKFAKIGKFMKSYQPKKITDNKKTIISQVIDQLPDDFIPFSNAIIINKLEFIFPFISSISKKKKNEVIVEGKIIYKPKKPDLDNLMKQFFDCLNGIVFIDDSLIVNIKEVRKIFGLTPGIKIELEEI